MIVDYNKYVSKMNLLKSKLSAMNDELIDSLKTDIVREFSKHLQLTPLPDDIKQFYEYNIKKNNLFLFLLESDYGLIIKIKLGILNNNASVEVRTTYKFQNDKDSEFKQGALVIEYKPGGRLSFDDFVDKTIIKLKKLNEVRKSNKEKREIKKTSNKYNL